MKKSKLKAVVKEAKKTARQSITLKLITDLKEEAGKMGQDSQKITKEIEKGSKKLAKKLSKSFKIDKAAIQESMDKANSDGILSTVQS